MYGCMHVVYFVFRVPHEQVKCDPLSRHIPSNKEMFYDVHLLDTAALPLLFLVYTWLGSSPLVIVYLLRLFEIVFPHEPMPAFGLPSVWLLCKHLATVSAFTVANNTSTQHMTRHLGAIKGKKSSKIVPWKRCMMKTVGQQWDLKL